jgi:oxygen-independent coproporphyrinogen III oxidase
VQDFEPAVQRAINRVQTFAQTQSVVALCRAQGIRSINVDLIYGLPEQTCESVARTVTQVIELAPDRLAVFGYAHLPQRLPQQRMIVEAALPDIGERLRQASLMAHMLQRAGYERVGLDHFAKSTDALAHSRVSRNFQGYTTDAVETLIGFGASSIGRLRQGYVQNATAVAEYMRRIETGRLAVAKGCAFSVDDRVRGHVIERLMCDLAFDRAELRARFGSAAACAEAEAEALMGREADGLLAPTSNGFKITEKGRPFVRSICAAFDAYLEDGNTRHSAGV